MLGRMGTRTLKLAVVVLVLVKGMVARTIYEQAIPPFILDMTRSNATVEEGKS